MQCRYCKEEIPPGSDDCPSCGHVPGEQEKMLEEAGVPVDRGTSGGNFFLFFPYMIMNVATTFFLAFGAQAFLVFALGRNLGLPWIVNGGLGLVAGFVAFNLVSFNLIDRYIDKEESLRGVATMAAIAGGLYMIDLVEFMLIDAIRTGVVDWNVVPQGFVWLVENVDDLLLWLLSAFGHHRHFGYFG